MIRSRRTLIGAGIAVAAMVALSAGVGSSQAQPAAAACSVTPVIPADVALGASPNLGLPSIEIPISFEVIGTCSPTQLRSFRWDGLSSDQASVLGVIGVGFGYKAGLRPEEVPLTTLEPGLIQVQQFAGPGPGVRVVTSFRTRRGTWLSPTATPGTNVISLLAQQWANDSWQPLGGRVFLQELRAGTWVSLKSQSLGPTGRATMTYPLTPGACASLSPGQSCANQPSSKSESGNQSYDPVHLEIAPVEHCGGANDRGALQWRSSTLSRYCAYFVGSGA